MRYERKPEFATNVSASTIRSLKKSHPDVKGVIEEAVMFACPVCGHASFDHSWVPSLPGDNMQCLIGLYDEDEPRCDCSGQVLESWAEWSLPSDEAELKAASKKAIMDAILGFYFPEMPKSDLLYTMSLILTA